MSTPVSSDPRRLKRPSRWRRIFQFSLRTLLILTTLAAVGCWWYLQPKIYVEELGGGALKLRRQVRERGKNDLNYRDSLRGGNLLDIGTWQLRDGRGEPLAIGRYADGQPHGFWRVYHANGHKAAEGQMFRGLRVGVWKTWDDQGRRESESAYAIVKQIVGVATSDQTRQPGLLVRVIPRSHIGGVMKNGLADDQIHLPDVSERHGPARSWHANGKLRFAGAYYSGSRDGKWAFYDEQGHVTESGEYRSGLREGTWLIRDKANGHTQTVEFARDRPRIESERLIAELKRDIASGGIERQVVAMHRLEEAGALGVPLLLNLLRDSNDDVKLMALRRLEALSERAEGGDHSLAQFSSAAAIATVEPFVNSRDDRLASRAALWLYRLSSEHRDSLYDRLIGLVRRSRDPFWKEQMLQSIYTADAARRQATFAELAHAAGPCGFPGSTGNTCGNTTPPPESPFIVIAQQCDDLGPLLKSALQSSDAKVRRFAILVIDRLAMREPVQSTNRGNGYAESCHRIPDAYRTLIEQAKNDPDATVREAAEGAGKRTFITVVG